jgi:uncharacterized protein YbjT (DUF2867 family)
MNIAVGVVIFAVALAVTMFVLNAAEKRRIAKLPPAGPQTWGPLQAGRRYEVIRAFTDFDGSEHPVGETWTFTGYSFLPYEDGLSLFVATEEVPLRHIRMQWRRETQGDVLDAFADYVRDVTSA